MLRIRRARSLYESQPDVSRLFEIKGGYRLGTIMNGVFTQLTSGGGQGVGLVRRLFSRRIWEQPVFQQPGR